MALNKKRRADKGTEVVPIRPSAHEPKTSEKIVPAVLGFGLAAVTLFIISRVLIIAGIAFASSALMASSSAGAANIAGADLFNFTYITSLSTAIVVASVFWAVTGLMLAAAIAAIAQENMDGAGGAYVFGYLLGMVIIVGIPLAVALPFTISAVRRRRRIRALEVGYSGWTPMSP